MTVSWRGHIKKAPFYGAYLNLMDPPGARVEFARLKCGFL